MTAKPENILTEPIIAELSKKERKLRDMMLESGSVLVAYSGGVDSTYLAAIATLELGSKAICCLGRSASVSEFQLGEAKTAASLGGFNLQIIDTNELSDPNYITNPTNRCFFCKQELFAELRKYADEIGVDHILDGTNVDDLAGHRPGRAAAMDAGVRSPLAEVGMTKTDIRKLSRRLGIKGWDKPASPCLSSRIAYGIPVSIRRLSKIEKGEALVRDLSFNEFRVRDHGDYARLEISVQELGRAQEIDLVGLVSEKFRQIGFDTVTLDERGYRSGALNEIEHD